jgi:hypothetical protein
VLLLDKGAKIDAKDTAGQDAAGPGRREPERRDAKLLRERGAKE